MPRRSVNLATGAATGVIALAAFLGTGEVVAVATGPGSTPATAIGEQVISHVPEWLKELAIRWFGESDKTVLLASVFLALTVGAGLAGVLAVRAGRAVPLAGAVLLGALAGAAGASRPAATPLDALPSLAGMVAASAAVLVLLPVGGRGPAPDGAREGAISRRRLLSTAGATAALGGAAFALGRTALARAYSVAASRAQVRLPAPAEAPPHVPGTSLEVSGLGPYITPNDRFYRVDTALVVPQVDLRSYRLRLHGMVEHPATFDFGQLLAMPLVERTITLVCVSNPVGGPYLGNARWLGVLLAPLLRQAGVRPDADQLLMTSVDGMTIGADLHAILDGRPALLALGMNGEPLPFEHGFPVRAVVPGIYGYASACKWLVDLEITTYAAKKAYWARRGYAEKAPVKLESRIDTPGSFAQLRAGPVTVAGSAWHPTVGVSAVEVQVDGGRWNRAVLAAAESVDTWRLWRWGWEATPGSHTLQVRATDQRGRVQTAVQTPVTPDGASGRQTVVVTVT